MVFTYEGKDRGSDSSPDIWWFSFITTLDSVILIKAAYAALNIDGEFMELTYKNIKEISQERLAIYLNR